MSWRRFNLLSLLLVSAFILPGGLIGMGAGPNNDTTPKGEVKRLQPIRIIEVTPVSPKFIAESNAAVKSVPKKVWQGINKAGWELHLAEFVVDARPRLKESRPRGWPSKMTWRNSDAMNDIANRRVIVAEKRYAQNGRVVPNYRVAGVMRHELGHSFDRVLGGRTGMRSSSSAFLRAYQTDLRSLPKAKKSTLGYYLQKRSAGRQEAYAEAFAITIGGGSDGKQKIFQDNFPRVLAFVRKDVANYEPK